MKQNQNIQIRVGVNLVCMTTFILSLFGVYQYYQNKQLLTSQINLLAQTMRTRLAKSLATPLWDADMDMLLDMIKSEMEDTRVHGIIVREAEKEDQILMGITRDLSGQLKKINENISGRFIIKQVEIFKDKKKLAGAEIYFPESYVSGELRKLIYNTIWTTIILNLFILGAFLLTIQNHLIKPVKKIVLQLNAKAEQFVSAAVQVSSASNQLAEGSTEQAASLEQTASSLELQSSTISQTAENAKQANLLMNEVREVIHIANQSMSKMISSMQNIKVASEETGKIIKTIDGIAFQTNLLALNAAVEAARAGDMGSGFAIVADEVRNLALQVANAAKNTSNLIEDTTRKVNDGFDLVVKTNQDFEKVSEKSMQTGNLIKKIDIASDEQSQGILQINKAVSEMERLTQQNAANSEESSSVSEIIQTQAEGMKLLVKDLVGLIIKSYR